MVAEIGPGSTRRIGAVDVGSNSVKLLVADVQGSELAEIERWGRVTRLARGLVRGRPIDLTALCATREAFGECVERARELGSEQLVAAATGGLRLAPNRSQVAAQLAEGILPLPILTASTEAYVSLLGLRAGSGWPTELIAIDLGGSSTGVPLVLAGDPTPRTLDLGAVTMTETYLPSDPPTTEELTDLDGHLRQVLATLPEPPADLLGSDQAIIGVGGTITALALLTFGHPVSSASVVHGECLGADRLVSLTDHLASLSNREREAILGISEGRADILVAGAHILLRVLERYRGTSMRVSGWGLRHGLAIAAGLDRASWSADSLTENRARCMATHTPQAIP